MVTSKREDVDFLLSLRQSERTDKSLELRGLSKPLIQRTSGFTIRCFAISLIVLRVLIQD